MIEPIDALIANNMHPKGEGEKRLFELLSAVFRHGHNFLSEPLIYQFSKEEECKALLHAFQEIPAQTAYIIKKDEKLFFLHVYQEIEEVAARYHEKRAQKENEEVVDKVRVSSLLRKSQGVLSSEQAAAMAHMASRSLVLLCGGPGTGKSYTAAQFVQAYAEAHAPQRIRICLTGPTGKAVQLLAKGVEKGLGDLYESYKEHIDVKTVHSLLEIFSSEEKKTCLPYHVVIVDEVSMLDMRLAYKLLSRIGEAKLILLGDPYQLPPIEPGDALALFKSLEEQNRTYMELTECRRIESPRILEFAHAVRKRDTNAIQHILSTQDAQLSFVSVADDAAYGMLEEKKEDLARAFKNQAHDAGRFPFVVLSPCMEGVWGVKAFNEKLNSVFPHQAPRPIIATKNNYEVNVMNGEMGMEHEGVLFFSNGRKIPSKMVKERQLGFAISVHKSQGSEFDHVLLVLPPNVDHIDERMLYTAITRAKKSIEIWGSLDRFLSIINKGACIPQGLTVVP